MWPLSERMTVSSINSIEKSEQCRRDENSISFFLSQSLSLSPAASLFQTIDAMRQRHVASNKYYKFSCESRMRRQNEERLACICMHCFDCKDSFRISDALMCRNMSWSQLNVRKQNGIKYSMAFPLLTRTRTHIHRTPYRLVLHAVIHFSVLEFKWNDKKKHTTISTNERCDIPRHTSSNDTEAHRALRQKHGTYLTKRSGNLSFLAGTQRTE